MRTKHTFRLPPDLMTKLSGYAARKGVSQSMIVEAALASHLSPDGADRLEAALARRLDRIGRHLERLERHVDISKNDARGDWAGAVIVRPHHADTEDPANGGIRREPELPEHEDIAPSTPRAVNEFELSDEDADDEQQRQRTLQRTMSAVARQVSLDPADDMQM